jgi:acetyl-CoA C-acetyltransferase
MIAAARRAAEDAGSAALLSRVDRILVPRGFWDYRDPGRIVAERVAAGGARTELLEIGVLQTTLFGRGARAIAEGEADVVLVTGGEAKYRSQRAEIAGGEAPLTRQAAGQQPDVVIRPERLPVSQLEIEAGLAMPVGQYAMVDNALRASEGQSIDEHRRELARLWADMSRVAATNPDAWSQEAVSADEIREPVGRNRMLAFPYTKLHNSQWNVDQAASLLFCSLETARALGVARDSLVFPLAVADANHMLPYTERRAVYRCPGFAKAGQRALARAGREQGEVSHLELYSCFPAAVRVQTREMGIDAEGPLTVTGGMAFAGGPLNNFVLQAMARMARVLREDPGSAGLVSAVSGVLAKQGVSLWSTEPGPGFGFDDVSEQVARELEPVEVVAGGEGAGRIATYTVLYEGQTPARAALVCDLEDGRRALRVVDDPELAALGTSEELCGRAVRLLPARLELV